MKNTLKSVTDGLYYSESFAHARKPVISLAIKIGTMAHYAFNRRPKNSMVVFEFEDIPQDRQISGALVTVMRPGSKSFADFAGIVDMLFGIGVLYRDHKFWFVNYNQVGLYASSVIDRAELFTMITIVAGTTIPVKEGWTPPQTKESVEVVEIFSDPAPASVAHGDKPNHTLLIPSADSAAQQLKEDKEFAPRSRYPAHYGRKQ